MMLALTRQEILNSLQEDWATYVQRFRSLSVAAQSDFLAQQGYARFADLLAHIVAWWEVGYQAVERYVADPQALPKEYDVDAFNAEAVARSGGLDEAAVVESFEKMRIFLAEFAKTLPDSAFENERVINQFNMEVVGHLDEHPIPDRK